MPLTLNMDAAQILATLWAMLPVLSKKEANMELIPKNMVANIVHATTMVVRNMLLPRAPDLSGICNQRNMYASVNEIGEAKPLYSACQK